MFSVGLSAEYETISTDDKGYLQAAAYRNLNGVYGRAGWRWLFIIRESDRVIWELMKRGSHHPPNLFARLRRLARTSQQSQAMVLHRGGARDCRQAYPPCRE